MEVLGGLGWAAARGDQLESRRAAEFNEISVELVPILIEQTEGRVGHITRIVPHHEDTLAFALLARVPSRRGEVRVRPERRTHLGEESLVRPLVSVASHSKYIILARSVSSVPQGSRVE